MPVGDQDHSVVPVTVTVALGRFHKPLDLGGGKVLAPAQFGVFWPARGNCSFFDGRTDEPQLRFCLHFDLPSVITARITLLLRAVVNRKMPLRRPDDCPTNLLSLVRQVRAQRQQTDASEDERRGLEHSFIEFVEAAWPFIDAVDYQPNWAVEALCEHLQAVTEGRISRLLVNFPPRCGKTLITSVCWIAWTWARRQRSFRSGPQVRFLTGSYSHTLALGNANLTRRLIQSPFYQHLWGSRYTFRDDQNTKVQVDNSAGGSRLATSVGGTLLGIGGDILVVDDPHNVAQAESEAERETVSNWWSELSTTRLNDPKQSAIVVIMQRLHEEDVSGKILSGDEDWCHLMIPMEYDWRRHCSTALGWDDPRGIDHDGVPLVERGIPRDAEAAAILDERDGELMWPQRFGAKEVAAIKVGLGPYMASGRLQQSPQPKSGGIFKREWWEVWEGSYFPICDLVIASLDGAYTDKEENDPSALTVWGVFQHPDIKKTLYRSDRGMAQAPANARHCYASRRARNCQDRRRTRNQTGEKHMVGRARRQGMGTHRVGGPHLFEMGCWYSAY